jgi:hypothetical protein
MVVVLALHGGLEGTHIVAQAGGGDIGDDLVHDPDSLGLVRHMGPGPNGNTGFHYIFLPIMIIK